MDVIDELPMRFHFGGYFLNDGKKLHYCEGTEAMSYIDRDKISLPELVGHLRDHCTVSEGSLLHWLFPGKEMENGLRVLVDDRVCQYMADNIVEGGVADIFVEAVAAEKGDGDINGSGSEDCVEVQPKEMLYIAPGESSVEIQKQVDHVQQFYLTPSEKQKEIITDKDEATINHDGSEESDDSEDDNYMPGDSSSSE
ncbi:unnamed protein product [Urochloa humidicola]